MVFTPQGAHALGKDVREWFLRAMQFASRALGKGLARASGPPGISVVIPYHSNADGLAVQLATLQAQSRPPEQIIVIDTSPDQSGAALCRKYRTARRLRCMSARVGIYEAWNRGLAWADQDRILIINDDVLLPLDSIKLLIAAASQAPALAYVPQTPPKQRGVRTCVDVPFDWWSKPGNGTPQLEPVSWLPGFCFMLTRQAIKEVGLFDQRFKVWCGDDDYQMRLHERARSLGIPAILRLNNLYVYHYGGLSYRYDSNQVWDQIDEDHAVYLAKYEHFEANEQPDLKAWSPKWRGAPDRHR
jgi:GT2 family glycosyltransferase